MTFPTETARVVVSGTIYGIEEWSFGVTLIPRDGATGGNITSIPQSVQDATQNFVVQSCSSAVRLRMIKANPLDTDGRYQSQGRTTAWEWPLPLPVGSGGNLQPAQIALAVSLRTANPRGLAGKGRFYLPGPNAGIGSDGYVAPSAVEGLQARAATWIAALNAGFPTWRVGVASDVRGGAIQPVTGVTVGRVLDTVRSRRTKLLEQYLEPVAIAGA